MIYLWILIPLLLGVGIFILVKNLGKDDDKKAQKLILEIGSITPK